jgi:glycosyltransferase involved in cell wall biosynthesis
MNISKSLNYPFSAAKDLGDKLLPILDSGVKISHINLYGPAWIFYYLTRNLIWNTDIKTITFQTDFNSHLSKQKNFMLDKMSRFVTDVVILKNESFESLFCAEESCQFQYNRNFLPMKSNFIDVVIPTKGVDLADIATLLTILNSQLVENDHVIVVDDNLTTMINLDKLPDLKCKISVIRGELKGVAAARNIGLKTGNNPLIQFIDSDDTIEKNFIEAQRNFHSNYLQVAATGTWLKAFGAHNRIYPQWDNISPLSVSACLPPAGVLMWKRNAIENLSGFNNQFENGFEDFDLVAKATVFRYPIVVNDRILYNYQRGHSSLSQNWSEMQITKNRTDVLEKLQTLCHHDFRAYVNFSQEFGTSLYSGNPDFLFNYEKEISYKFLLPFLVVGQLLPKPFKIMITRIFLFLGFTIPSTHVREKQKIRLWNNIKNFKIAQLLWAKTPRRLKKKLFKTFHRVNNSTL